jgi:ABC-type sugar transport system ATPase subunit
MRTKIKKLHLRIKAATVYVTHDQIEAMTLADASPGTKVICGIRPEHISIADDGIESIVEVMEPTGAEIQIFADINKQQIFRGRPRAHPSQSWRCDLPQGQLKQDSSVRSRNGRPPALRRWSLSFIQGTSVT